MLDEGVRQYMSGSDFEAYNKLMLRHIVQAGTDGIARSALMLKPGVRSANSKNDFENGLKWLEMTEQVEAKITTGRGRPGVRLFAVDRSLQ
jgi:hypothetical protein